MPKTKQIHIAYIGRLEKEKGIEIVIEAIERSIVQERNIYWHICGDGTYFEALQRIQHSHLKIYGRLDRQALHTVLEKIDLVLMPSLFLETFGLVALETLTRGVAVCGFSQGGLTDFIHPSLALDPQDPVSSFFDIIDRNTFPLLDISSFSYILWIEKLEKLTDGIDSIFMINDYLDPIGGAEQYFCDLVRILRSLGKTVVVFGHTGYTNRYIRIGLMLTAPIAFWRGYALRRHIRASNPDLIWMHSVLRYIGPHGVRVVSKSARKTYCTQHDIGLITALPSQVYAETQIPKSPSMRDWVPRNIGFTTVVIVVIKWLYIRWIWKYLRNDTITHIIPSAWMKIHFQKYCTTPPVVFQHTTFPLTSKRH